MEKKTLKVVNKKIAFPPLIYSLKNVSLNFVQNQRHWPQSVVIKHGMTHFLFPDSPTLGQTTYGQTTNGQKRDKGSNNIGSKWKKTFYELFQG